MQLTSGELKKVFKKSAFGLVSFSSSADWLPKIQYKATLEGATSNIQT